MTDRRPIFTPMSLPPGFLDELRTRTSLAQVAGRKVIWDARKSNQGKGDMWAPCPFHTEKTPSFHVDDRQGFYYCFGCHAKGDAISFVRETENVGFMDAVEILAREAGMTIPARDPQAQEKADHRSLLTEVMEQAVQHYRLQLKTSTAAAARDYLTRRGFSEKSLTRWEIGFAPDDRQALFSHLTGKGVAADLLVDAGLSVKPDDGGTPFDRFRGRIIFPIRDARGRAIALGGRAMDPNARAKYLNSPETALFDKGRSLFNHGPAREATGKGQPLIVAEGYMDVIALAEAGFTGAVAPLGTAITEDQLRAMWRIHPEPIIALDGDQAGLRAAMRLIDVALPLLEAGQSLRFAMLPEGQDPDDLINAQGAGVMRKLLERAQPMVQLLWRRETEGHVFDSPERKAALDKRLRAAIRRIQDPSLRTHYTDDIRHLRAALFGQRQGNTRRADRFQRRGPAMPHAETRASALAAGQGGVTEHLREAVILAVLLRNPDQLRIFESELEGLTTTRTDHRAIQDALLQQAHSPPEAVYDNVTEIVGAGALEKLLGQNHLAIVPSVAAPGDAENAALCLAQEFAKLTAAQGAEREIEEAARDLAEVADEGLTWRLGQVAEARARAVKSQTEDRTVYDTADNGVRIRRTEKEELEKLLQGIESQK